MLSSKRFTGSYTIESTDGGTLTLGATGDAVSVPGDLTVLGTLTTINADNLSIKDNVIIINDGETGPGVSLGTAGLEVDRGDGVTAGQIPAKILWDETNDAWVVDNGDGAGAVNEIATTAIGGTFLQNVVEDATPQLGGVLGLDVNSLPIFATTNNNVAVTVTGTGNIVLTAGANGEIRMAAPVMIQGAAPTTAPAAAEAALFKGADTGGGTQIHFQNNIETGELVSKTKALVFGLIL